MVAGHLREQNGIYQMILSYKDVDGKRVSKSISTGLKVRGNARNANKMLLETRQTFYDPKMAPEFIPEVMKEQISMLEIVPAAELPTVESDTLAPRQALVRLSSDDYEIVTPDVDLLLKPKEEILFSDYLIYWLKMMRNNIALSTYGGYSYNIEHCIAPYFSKIGCTLAEIEKSPFMIQAFYDYERTTRGIQNNTILRHHANIRKALQYIFKLGKIDSNPADRIERPQKNPFESDIYNEIELKSLFDLFHGDPLELAVILASFYGLRRSEIVGLKWKNIDFESNTITIKHVVTQATIDGRYQMIKKDQPKTKSSTRSLPLVPPIRAVLLELKKIQVQNQRLFADSYCKDYTEYIYVNSMGELIKPGFLTQHFRLLCDKNNMKYIRFHDLRHSCATLLYNSGVSMKAIQEWLGHSSIATTFNIYTHLNHKSKVSSANAIIGLLECGNKKELDIAAN